MINKINGKLYDYLLPNLNYKEVTMDIYKSSNINTVENSNFSIHVIDKSVLYVLPYFLQKRGNAALYT